MLSVLWLSALAPPLTPPRVSGRGAGWVEVAVQLDEVSLTVLEGDVSVQDELVDSALTVDDSAADEDPYGVVLWPAAQAVARELVALTDGSGEPLLRSGSVLLELGAGTGLCALAAASVGATALATDYRPEPLELIERATASNSERLGKALAVTTSIFDICDEAATLPPADVVAAADVLYFASTGRALARRCVQALRSGTRLVVIGDCDRPGRGAFLEELVAEGVSPSAARFQDVSGWTAGTARNDLVAPDDSAPRAVSVGVLKLRAADLEGSGAGLEGGGVGRDPLQEASRLRGGRAGEGVPPRIRAFLHAVCEPAPNSTSVELCVHTALLLAASSSAVKSVLADQWAVIRHRPQADQAKGLRGAILSRRRRAAQVGQLLGAAAYTPRIVFLAGLMLRSVQQATELRRVFEPSLGYAAGALLAARFARREWLSCMLLGWGAGGGYWAAFRVAPPGAGPAATP